MKSFIFVCISFFIFASVSKAQFNKGDFEFSFTGSLSSMTYESSVNNSPYYQSGSHSETRTTGNISFSPGYYFVDNLSIEAEIGLSAVEKMQPSEYLLFNLSYTHLMSDSKVALFAHAGYGFSNSVEVSNYNNAIVRTSDKFDVKVINIGGGLKYMITPNVIARSEINYRIHKWTEDSFYSVDNKISNIALVFGFSILI